MATTLTTTFNYQLAPNYLTSGIAVEAGSPAAAPVFDVTGTLGNGVLSDQADILYYETRSIASSATDTFDLTGGLTDSFGNVLTFASVVKVWIRNQATDANRDLEIAGNLMSVIGGSGTDKQILRAGGLYLQYAPVDGFVVTDTTADTLTIENVSAGTFRYDIALIGRTA